MRFKAIAQAKAEIARKDMLAFISDVYRQNLPRYLY
jgi:hypothetical protein